MSAGNVKKFDTEKADKRRLIRRVFSLNTWPISEDGIDGWIIDLHKGKFTSKGFLYAVEKYKQAGGSRPPRPGDLFTFLRAYKAAHKDGAEKLAEPSEASRAAGREYLGRLRAGALSELSRAEEDNLLSQLDKKDKDGNPAPITLPDKLRNLEPAKETPRPGPVKPEEAADVENKLLAEARERYKNMPARKEVPGAGEMYFPEVLPSPHIGRTEQEPGKK